MMILYNTLMGVCAGVGTLTFTHLLRGTQLRKNIEDGRAHGITFLVVGVPLLILSLHMAITWPLTANPPINIAFAEPAVILALLFIAAGIVLCREVDLLSWNTQPITWLICALGVMLIAISSAILSYNLIGDAPSQEPITGQFKGWENTTFGLVYLLSGFGCLVMPWVHKSRAATQVAYWSLTIAGVFFLVFSLLNYRTHIGMLINLERGTNYRW